MSIVSKVDKATTLLKFVHKIKEILNKNPDFIKDTANINYTYHIKVVDNIGDEVSKFTIQLKTGQMSIINLSKPNVIFVLTEQAFFGIIEGRMTLEETYFSGESDIWSSDGNWSTHLPGLKNTFSRIEQATRQEMGNI